MLPPAGPAAGWSPADECDAVAELELLGRRYAPTPPYRTLGAQ